MLMRDGQVLIDLAANRMAWAILQLPGKAALQRVKQFPNPDPAPNAKPDLKALQTFIARQYPGFPVPKSLP